MIQQKIIMRLGLISVLTLTAGCNSISPPKHASAKAAGLAQVIPAVSPSFYNQKKADGKFVLSCMQLAIAKATIHSKNALTPEAEQVVEGHLSAIRTVIIMRCTK